MNPAVTNLAVETAWSDHVTVLPVVLPIAVAGAMFLLDERRRKLKASLSFATILALIAIAVTLVVSVSDAPRVYRLGNWAAPYGIVLVADRLSAMMLALSSVLGLCALVFSFARWGRAGPRFHGLFLLLLMGVNGAFLTGDLFNLFVFFEVMLAASYGLVLHGSGETRIRAGLGYIAVNLVASLFFLVGVSLIYGTMGTLNMADLARRLAGPPEGEIALFEIGCAILGLAFLIKCSAWPLGFWLPPTYAAATAPAAAILAILSKVGIYVVVRLSLLVFGEGVSAGFGQTVLFAAGLATLAFGTIGLLAARDLTRAAGYAVMVSSGTVLAALGSGNDRALAGALYYLVGSTLAAGALFLLAEILQRGRDPAEAAAPVFADEYRDPFDDEDSVEVGSVIPAGVAILGVGFLLCTLMLAGIPPLAGFVGKLAIFVGAAGAPSPAGWWLIAALTLSSLFTLMPLVRLGILNIWVRDADKPPTLARSEVAALAGLLATCLALSVWGGPALAYADATVGWLTQPQDYVRAVLGGPAP